MNRKTLSIIGVVVIFILALLAFFFLRMSSVDTPVESLPRECLIFQSDDATRPCYRESSISIPATPVVVPNTPSYPSGTISNSTMIMMPTDCALSGSTFERNDCVAKKAVESKNTQLCSLIVGSLAQSACVRDTSSPQAIALPSISQSYESFIRSIISINTSTTVSPLATTSNLGANIFSDVSIASDPRLTKEAFDKRFKDDAPLALFGMSAYQVRPGENVILQGTGFSDINEVHFDGTIIIGNSTDGFTIVTNAPGQVGVYEIWITNTKGSSRSVERPIKITVTDNPAQLPIVLSISPAVPKVTDTVIVGGSGFSVSNTISTSLGPLLGVSSNGSSMQFKISDLPIVPLIKDLKEVKGKIIPVQMYVQSDGGITKEIFTFDVQF